MQTTGNHRRFHRSFRIRSSLDAAWRAYFTAALAADPALEALRNRAVAGVGEAMRDYVAETRRLRQRFTEDLSEARFRTFVTAVLRERPDLRAMWAASGSGDGTIGDLNRLGAAVARLRKEYAETPIAWGYVAGSQWVIRCPHCGGRHYHGAPDGAEDVGGLRVPHCLDGAAYRILPEVLP